MIVAESLERVQDPLGTVLRPSGPATPDRVLSAICRPLARPCYQGELPAWLFDCQVPIVRRLIPPLRQHSGAMLATPVGTGKTYMALAAAAAFSRPVLALVPAGLVHQWEDAARVTGVQILIWTHERISRGCLPSGLGSSRPHALVVIDESHHFRNPGTRRYRHLAPALQRCQVLLITGTPVVNTMADLSHQLRLAIRDDALRPNGIPSLTDHLNESGPAHPSLGTLVIASNARLEGLPSRRRRREIPGSGTGGPEALIEQLQLSSNSAIRELLRTVLWRAAVSSPAAFEGCVRRYRALLRQASDARAAGRSLDRAALRSWIGQEPGQLVFWELVTENEQNGDLDLDDLQRLETWPQRIEEPADPKLEKLRDLLARPGRTLVFTAFRETVHYLRRQLGGSRIAWCTGEAAGIGHATLPRHTVLAWFGLDRPEGPGPMVLITTDVAAEGLNLQGADRVIHYDLPWTAIRLDQREGRVRRLGSPHREVEIVRFAPPANLVDRLHQISLLRRKRLLPRRAGVSGPMVRAWEWRDRLAVRYGDAAAPGAWAAVSSVEPGALIGWSLVSEAGRWPVLGFLDQSGRWYEEPERIDRCLAAAGEIRAARPGELECVLERLAPVVRARLQDLQHARWECTSRPGSVSRLLRRVNRMVPGAARSRDAAALARLERALEFLSSGHTAGESRWIEDLVRLPDHALLAALAACRPTPPVPAPAVVLNGVLLFGPHEW